MSTLTLLLNLFCNSSCLEKHSSLYTAPEQQPKAKTDCPSKRLKFKFTEKFLWRSHTLSDCKGELQVLLSGQVPKDRVAYTKIDIAPAFDTRDDDIYRNIRRCSLAPLGETYMIKQFELDSRSGKHFNHVIKIEPRENNSILPQPPPNIADLVQR